jgi:hypothetical protein
MDEVLILLRKSSRYATLGGWDDTAFPRHDGARQRAGDLSANAGDIIALSIHPGTGRVI